MIKIAYRKVYDSLNSGDACCELLFFREGRRFRLEESVYVTIADEKYVYGIVLGPLNFLEMKVPRQPDDSYAIVPDEKALSSLMLGSELEFMKKNNALRKEAFYELVINDLTVTLWVDHADVPQKLCVMDGTRKVIEIIYDSYETDLPFVPKLFRPSVPLLDRIIYRLIFKHQISKLPDDVIGGSALPSALYISFPFFSRFFSLMTGRKHEPFMFCLYGDKGRCYDETDSVTAYFNSILEQSRLHQMVAMAFLFVALVLATFWPYFLALSFFSFMFFFWAYWNVKVNIVCPECGKNLSYLLLDPSYSGSIGTLLLQGHWSSRFSECPFCKHPLMKNTEKNNVP